MTTTDLAAYIEAHSFGMTDERSIQDGIASLLATLALPVEREARLTPRDVVDFLVGGIAVEVKLRCGLSEVTRQLHRYAQSERVGEILLVTAQLRLGRVPRSLNGKPITVATLLGSCL